MRFLDVLDNLRISIFKKCFRKYFQKMKFIKIFSKNELYKNIEDDIKYYCRYKIIFNIIIMLKVTFFNYVPKSMISHCNPSHFRFILLNSNVGTLETLARHREKHIFMTVIMEKFPIKNIFVKYLKKLFKNVR